MGDVLSYFCAKSKEEKRRHWGGVITPVEMEVVLRLLRVFHNELAREMRPVISLLTVGQELT